MHSKPRNSRARPVALATAITLALGAAGVQAASQSGEKKNMNRVGHTDLQGRPSYQPNVIKYPDGRFIAVRRPAQRQSRAGAAARLTRCPIRSTATRARTTGR